MPRKEQPPVRVVHYLPHRPSNIHIYIDKLPLRRKPDNLLFIEAPLPSLATAAGVRSLPEIGREPTSSLTFIPDSDTVDAMQDLMTDIRYPVIVGPRLTEPFESTGHMLYDTLDDGDVFTTPPTTPTREPVLSPYPEIPSTLANSDDDMPDIYFIQNPDQVVLPLSQNPIGRKRSAPEPLGAPPSRKTTYEPRGHQVQVCGVHHLEPTRNLTRSFDSVSTGLSTRAAFTTGTTPSTSFYTESAATSFGQSTADLASDQLIKEQAEHNRKILSNTHLDPIDDLMDISFDTPRRTSSHNTRPAKETIPAPSHDGDRLASYLKEKSPFGKPLPPDCSALLLTNEVKRS